ncbi:uncharacterized protein LOC121418693 [Lytechinus variegatus]|uniref:uncharacterized protein LOC121418693 n=1 Tax=Lytechinus variegatus TaxID=7654 RepID=UPI001BB1BA84|nr:uncharacterized protein LOC121418693 [Lytechinus variegatus]
MVDSNLIVGVDVGGTYTDAVCLREGRVMGVVKEPTTQDVTGGVKHSIQSLIRVLQEQGNPTNFRQVNIGTTHFVNAVLQRRHLTRVAILRLCGTASHALEPCVEFPDDLKQAVYDSHYFLNGGFNYDGQTITCLDFDEVLSCLNELRERGITNIVVSCVFAPVNGDQEFQVRDFIREHYKEASVTLSHEIGQMGLLERENAAILNESLKPLCRQTVRAFSQALQELNIKCPFFMTQNDGTIISSELALDLPVRTFSSGPTNSMRGAAHLSGVTDNAIVIDIGGTSTDVGYLMKGFPRESSSRSHIAGVSTNFRMPDVQSIGLGGGSLVQGDHLENIAVGPRSVGYRLLSEGLTFGGNTLTATDIAVAAGLAEVGDTAKVAHIPKNTVDSAVDKMHKMVEEVIDQIKISSDDVPVIVVGGGSILIDENRGLQGASRLIKPPHYQSANAVGASLSQVSGTVDYLVNVAEVSREDAIKTAEVRARHAAVANGADETTLEITERQSVGLAYLPGHVIRIKVKAVGRLAISSLESINSSYQTEEVPVKAEAPPSKQSCDIGSDQSEMARQDAEQTTVKSTDEIDYQPHIDPSTGEWIVSERDIEYITIGAGLLGSGGGGSPYMGKLRALKQLRSGKRIRIIAPERFGTTPALQGKVPSVAFMGAPAVLIEKLVSGTEIPRGLTCLQDILSANPDDVRHQAAPLENAESSLNDGLVFVKDYTMCSSNSTSDKICAILSAEIGGLNSIEPLITGADLDVPILDCDGMGRAFPELQMFLPTIHKKPLYPAVLVSDGSQQSVIAEAANSVQVENCFRTVVGTQMGCSGGVVLAPLSAEDISATTIPYSYSRAWNLGRVVMTSQISSSDPIQAIVQAGNGVLLVSGKITNVNRETTGGFDKGDVLVAGSGEYSGVSFLISFQNENLVAKERKMVDNVRQEKIVAMTPDIIVITDADKGHPITTEEVQYGLRVAVIALPSPPALRSPQVLGVVGPRAFNYDVDFVPIADYMPPTPIPPIP